MPPNPVTNLKYRDITYFNSFGAECIPKEIQKSTGSKNIAANIYETQAYDSLMCG